MSKNETKIKNYSKYFFPSFLIIIILILSIVIYNNTNANLRNAIKRGFEI